MKKSILMFCAFFANQVTFAFGIEWEWVEPSTNFRLAFAGIHSGEEAEETCTHVGGLMLQLDSSLDVKLLNRFVTANRTKIASFPVKTFEWPNGGADSVVISEKIIWANDPITLASSEELAMKMSQLCAQTSDPDILEICRNPILNKSHPEHTGLAMAFTIRQPETSELRTHILAHLKSDLGAVVCFMP